jgi:hypothetical protein
METSHTEALARCERELQSLADTFDAPAWLVAMGANDWQLERSLILQDALQNDN